MWSGFEVLGEWSVWTYGHFVIWSTFVLWAQYLVEDNVENFDIDRICSMSEELRGKWESGAEGLMSKLRQISTIWVPSWDPNYWTFWAKYFFIQSLKNLNGKQDVIFILMSCVLTQTHFVDRSKVFSFFGCNYPRWVEWTVKVEVSRYGPGVAQRVSRGIPLLFHDRGTRRGWVVSSTPRPQFTPGKYSVPILQEAGWAGLDGRKISSPPEFVPGPSSS